MMKRSQEWDHSSKFGWSKLCAHKTGWFLKMTRKIGWFCLKFGRTVLSVSLSSSSPWKMAPRAIGSEFGAPEVSGAKAIRKLNLVILETLFLNITIFHRFLVWWIFAELLSKSRVNSGTISRPMFNSYVDLRVGGFFFCPKIVTRDHNISPGKSEDTCCWSRMTLQTPHSKTKFKGQNRVGVPVVKMSRKKQFTFENKNQGKEDI